MIAPCAIVYMNLGPYHIARLRALTAALPSVHAVELAVEQKLYPWRPSRDHLGFPLTTLFPNRACESIPQKKQCEAVRRILSRIDPGVVITAGYREPVMRAATQWARAHGRASVLLFVSTQLDRPRRWWRERLKTHLIRRYTGIAATGSRAEEYAVQLGADRQCVRRIGNIVDNEYYAARAESVLQNEDQERSRLGLPRKYFLNVSRFSPEKNLARLLTAFAAYRTDGGCWDLVLVGSGPQDRQLRAMVQEQNISGIHFVGWKSHEELPSYYALASCFILPSISETWGLVVNEAMACGLPVLVSRNCGCVPELCHDGQNGYSFDPNLTEGMTKLLLNISSNDRQLPALGKMSRKIISTFTPQIWAGAIRDCVLASMEVQARG